MRWEFSINFQKLVGFALSCIFMTTELLAVNSENVIAQAIILNSTGNNFYASLIRENEWKRVYGEDSQFIENFPFSEYDLTNIPSQGVFFVDRINDSIKNTLRSGSPWESVNQQIIQTYTKQGTIALDIGSHIGTHTVTMSECVGKTGKVIAFEPNKKIYRELCVNMALNHCANVTPLRCAIGKEQGIIQVVVSHPLNEGGSYVIKESGGSNTAAMIRLDDLQLTNVSFIKIDVENLEADVIDGAVETIKRCRPIMLIEIQGNGERPWQLGEDTQKMGLESMRKIQELGYRLQKVAGVDYLAFPE